MMKPIRITLLLGIFLPLLGVLGLLMDWISTEERPGWVLGGLAAQYSNYGQPQRDKYFWKTRDKAGLLIDRDFRNRLQSWSIKRSLAKLERLHDSEEAVTVADLLGDEVTRYHVTCIAPWVRTDDAMGLVQALLDSVLKVTLPDGGPSYRQRILYTGNPSLLPPWRPLGMAIPRIQAVLKYQNGREGILLLGSNGEVLVQDCKGIYWWYGWDKLGDRLSDSVRTNSGTNGSQPICTVTNRMQSVGASSR